MTINEPDSDINDYYHHYNKYRILVCVTCRVIFRANPIGSGMVFQTIRILMHIHYYTAKFAHMNGHWKTYDFTTTLDVFDGGSHTKWST